MKRIRLLVLLSALAIALPVGVLSGIAKATGSTGSTSSLSINQNAQYDVLGNVIHVGLRARCPVTPDPVTGDPLPGTIHVRVVQDPPESTMHTEGDSLVKQVVCDGQTHTVGATIFDPLFTEGFDAGRAYATADFTFPPSATATAASWINIIVMPG
jgi:hypothetical protein